MQSPKNGIYEIPLTLPILFSNSTPPIAHLQLNFLCSVLLMLSTLSLLSLNHLLLHHNSPLSVNSF